VVRMEGNASEATSGWKSALLKPFNFIFRKENHGKRGATLPVSIIGTYPRPHYRAGLTRSTAPARVCCWIAPHS
jgi:hypothetical protein